MTLMSFAKTALALCLYLPALAQRPPSEPKELLAYIDSKGAEAVVRQLTSGNESEWHSVIHNIDMGSSPWLDVAKKLLPATDAGGTQDLYVALAIALTHNPNGVLSMVGSRLPIEQVCTVPFIEPDDKTVQQHKLRVRAALQKVTSEALLPKKAACLESIAK